MLTVPVSGWRLAAPHGQRLAQGRICAVQASGLGDVQFKRRAVLLHGNALNIQPVIGREPVVHIPLARPVFILGSGRKHDRQGLFDFRIAAPVTLAAALHALPTANAFFNVEQGRVFRMLGRGARALGFGPGIQPRSRNACRRGRATRKLRRVSAMYAPHRHVQAQGCSRIADYYDSFAIWHIPKKSAIYSILLWYGLKGQANRQSKAESLSENEGEGRQARKSDPRSWEVRPNSPQQGAG